MFKRHYNRVIVACGFAFLFVNIGMASTAFSVHQPYLVALEGIGDTGGSLILSVRTASSLLAMVFVDRFYRLFDIRVGVFVATLLTGSGFLIYGLSETLWQFMSGAILLGAGYGFGGMVAITYIANRWFANGLGALVGIATMGSGVATIVMPVIVLQIVHNASLPVAFFHEAAIAAVVAFGMLVLLRNRPSDLDIGPYEAPEKKTKKKSRGARQLEPAPKYEHFILLVAMVGVGIFSCLAITYISVLATSNGYNSVLAALLVSIAGISLTVAKPITGALFDLLGGIWATAIMFSVGIFGYVLCCLAPVENEWLMIAAAIIIGAGISLGSVGTSVWSIDLSNRDTRNQEIKNFQVAYAVGAFIANTIPGFVKDALGSYTISYVFVLVLTIISALLIIRYYKKYTHR